MGQRVERFEDLIAWQKARQMTAEIYAITAQGDFARDFGLRNQIRRAAVSVMSNIAEGFERMKRGEFHQFLSIAKGSCAEVRAQLYVALDALLERGKVPAADGNRTGGWTGARRSPLLARTTAAD